MKLSELITTDKGLFKYIDEVSPLPWSEVVTPYELDSAFMFKNGCKTVSGKVLKMFSDLGEEETLSSLAKIISNMYANKWGQLFEAFNIDYPVNVESRETSDDVNTGTNSVKNTVSAYDSEVLVPDSGRDGTTEYNHKITKDKISLSAIQKNIELLQDSLLYDIVFTDTKSLILLLVY